MWLTDSTSLAVTEPRAAERLLPPCRLGYGRSFGPGRFASRLFFLRRATGPCRADSCPDCGRRSPSCPGLGRPACLCLAVDPCCPSRSCLCPDRLYGRCVGRLVCPCLVDFPVCLCL